MIWEVRHKWPSGAKFNFNCYRHCSIQVIWEGRGVGQFLYSKEGVALGHPLTMIVYGLGVLPLIKELQEAHTKVF